MSRNSPSPIHFRKVLVANRGEIARRICRTLHDMGIASVAVFSDADQHSPHVDEADEAVRLGPAPSQQSYLDIDRVLRAAELTGADAVHPGYGFLAENADFAARCADAGMVFIGPSPAAIQQMGNKTAAKRLAAEAEVPVLEGFSADGLDEETVRQRAEEVGWPLMLKAAAGGGGKGMRVVEDAAELPAAMRSAARQARGAFGDDALLIERYVPDARHVEVQIFGDATGHIVHLFERDCSAQRRHQKVIEECPSPAVGEALRQRMGEAAIRLAGAVSYQGAGTVEFLLDGDGQFYFLEMNTRLQVEHAVTEAVTGLDLVRLQVEVAQGQPLALDQDDLEINGHAIEARLYAEDPANHFLPAAGTLSLWHAPIAELPGIRVDSGIKSGSEISVHYDPMLAKVIAHGQTRAEALARLHRALSKLAIAGLATNRQFLLAVLEHDAFVRGDIPGFLERHDSLCHTPIPPETLIWHAVAATIHWLEQRQQQPTPLPSGIPDSWRLTGTRTQIQDLEHASGPIRVQYTQLQPGQYSFRVALPETAITSPTKTTADERNVLVHHTGDQLTLEIDGVRRSCRVAHHAAGEGLSVHGLGRVSELAPSLRFPQRQSTAVAGGCAAPMTGLVVEVLVSEGEQVNAGSPLVVLEAMKMEHRLMAQSDGIIESVRVRSGQMVDPDDILVVVKATDPET